MTDNVIRVIMNFGATNGRAVKATLNPAARNREAKVKLSQPVVVPWNAIGGPEESRSRTMVSGLLAGLAEQEGFQVSDIQAAYVAAAGNWTGGYAKLAKYARGGIDFDDCLTGAGVSHSALRRWANDAEPEGLGAILHRRPLTLWQPGKVKLPTSYTVMRVGTGDAVVRITVSKRGGHILVQRGEGGNPPYNPHALGALGETLAPYVKLWITEGLRDLECLEKEGVEWQATTELRMEHWTAAPGLSVLAYIFNGAILTPEEVSRAMMDPRNPLGNQVREWYSELLALHVRTISMHPTTDQIIFGGHLSSQPHMVDQKIFCAALGNAPRPEHQEMMGRMVVGSLDPLDDADCGSLGCAYHLLDIIWPGQTNVEFLRPGEEEAE